MSIKIYCLIDPVDNLIKYVGRTSVSLSLRLAQHTTITNSGFKNAKTQWINSLRENGLKPTIQEIETCNDIKQAKERELFWIDEFHKNGYELLNMQVTGRNRVKKYRLSAGRKRTDEELIAPLLEFYNRNRKFPKSINGKCKWREEDVDECFELGVANIATYIRRFGSYVQLCKSLSGKDEPHGAQRYTDEDLINQLVLMKKKYGKYPTIGKGWRWTEPFCEENIATSLTFRKRFGNYTNVKKLADEKYSFK